MARDESYKGRTVEWEITRGLDAIRSYAGAPRFLIPDEQCTMLRPPLGAPNRSHLKYDPFCSLVIYVTHDRTRVFVGVGDPCDRVARPADDVEIEALADRFDLQELRQVLEQRRAAVPPGQPLLGA